MNTDHDVILDLLPLYKEGLASEASRALVEEHLKDCSACAAELDMLTNSLPSIQVATVPFKGISRNLKKRRWLTALLAASLVLAFGVAFTAFATERIYLNWSQAKQLLQFTQREGLVQVDILQPGIYASVSRLVDPDRPGIQVEEISLYTRRFDRGPGQQQLLLERESAQRLSIYYVKAGELSELAFGDEQFTDGGYMTLPRLALIYYVKLAAILALLLFLLLLIFYNKPKARLVLKILLGLPLSYLGGQLLVKGFSTLSYDSLARDLGWILACAVSLYAAWLAFWALRRQALKGRLP